LWSDEEERKAEEKERLEKEAREQTQKEKDNNKNQDHPKDQEKKCEFCNRNNIEDGKKITIEGKGEYKVCQPCYDLYGDKGDENKKDRDDNNNRERERERERERDKFAPFVARIQF